MELYLEQRNKFLLKWSGTSFKIKFIHYFLMLWSEGRCFSTTLRYFMLWVNIT